MLDGVYALLLQKCKSRLGTIETFGSRIGPIRTQYWLQSTGDFTLTRAAPHITQQSRLGLLRIGLKSRVCTLFGHVSGYEHRYPN